MRERLDNLMSLDRRQWTVGALSGLAYLLFVAIPTDLIDTPFFGREIPPTWWSWPSLIVTTVLVTVLTATYIKPTWQKDAEDMAAARATEGTPDTPTGTAPTCSADHVAASGTNAADAASAPALASPATSDISDGTGPATDNTSPSATDEERPSRAGMLGAALAYFAVGCPVCNKLVLLALGWNGAITWFEPFQPVLQVAAVLLLAWALERRLKNLYSCEPTAPRARATVGSSA